MRCGFHITPEMTMNGLIPTTPSTIVRDLLITATFTALILATWSMGTSEAAVSALTGCPDVALALGYQQATQ